MSESKDIKFEGWGAFDKTSIQGNFKWFEYEPKTFCEDDIECTYSLPFFLNDGLMIQSKFSIAEFARVTCIPHLPDGET
jgi:hypothetical protein